MVVEAKHCTKCDTLKLTDEFYRNVTKQDGYQDWCKKCNAAYAAEQRARFATSYRVGT